MRSDRELKGRKPCLSAGAAQRARSKGTQRGPEAIQKDYKIIRRRLMMPAIVDDIQSCQSLNQVNQGSDIVAHAG